MIRAFALSCLAFLALPATVHAFERVTDRAAFMALVGGKDLTMPIYGLALSIQDNGTIEGRAVGWDITGSWTWDGGYFCRDMDWSGYEIGYNCQLVEVAGGRIRFTVDRGAGDDAVLWIR